MYSLFPCHPLLSWDTWTSLLVCLFRVYFLVVFRVPKPSILKGHHLFFLSRSSIHSWCLLKLLWLPKVKTSTQVRTHMCLGICVKSQFTCLLFLLLPTLFSRRIAGHHLCTYIHTYICLPAPQARILEWIAVLSSKGSSQPRDQTHVSYVYLHCRQVLYH